MDKFMKRIDPLLTKITTEVHMLAVRDALITVVPFLFVGGLATFFAYVAFADTGFMAKVLDAQTLASCSSFFVRVNRGTIALMSIYLAAMIPYFMGNARNYDNPLALAMCGLGAFIIFTPLSDTYGYFGTQGVMLAIVIGLTSSELFMRLSKVDRLKWDLGGNIPEVVTRSFQNIFVISIVMVLYGLIATMINLLSGMETMAWIYAVLQVPLMNVGATLPGGIVYWVIGGFFFTLGIQPSGIQAPIEAAMIAGLDAGTIFNQPFHYVYCNYGGAGGAWALVICLLVFSKRKELKSVGKLCIFPELFNISEPVMFGLPVVFNFIFLIPMILVPVVDGIIAYALTAAGILPILTNPVVWSIPVFINGFIASNGSVAVFICQAGLFVLDVFLWLPFVKVYERSLGEEVETEVMTSEGEKADGDR